ncbi:hypothetical protein [Natronogracilivirga saccharolytica]|uniref:Uncharacterized protein n=1 Tax=Natronogracilivirga saccharolytica TaxID=2812953 RepID=A0A8J7RPD4_9BACT|nr:hypothetical protein [Natronogracilivirga saccharolytica]MBP3193728.1 hypothetical protein [Natronogracilivirga saccharolytica]
MSYREESYYKEFRDLLGELKSRLSELKTERTSLKSENRKLSNELKEVRSQLAESGRETVRLREELDQLKAAKEQNESSEISSSHSTGGEPEQGTSTAHSDVDSNKTTADVEQDLFSELGKNEKVVLRQQITELIRRIDKHLERSRQ